MTLSTFLYILVATTLTGLLFPLFNEESNKYFITGISILWFSFLGWIGAGIYYLISFL